MDARKRLHWLHGLNFYSLSEIRSQLSSIPSCWPFRHSSHEPFACVCRIWYRLSYIPTQTSYRVEHPSCKHGVRRICQLYTTGRPARKLTWCERPRDHLDYRRRDTIQGSSPQNTERAKTVTTPRLEEYDFGHALGTLTFYTSPLRKCRKTNRKTFWLLIL